MTHTSGDWKTNVYKDCIVCNETIICERPHGGRGKDDFEANAKLIAAAPMMLEALLEISEGKGAFSRDPLEHADNCINDMKSLALAAIKKATE